MGVAKVIFYLDEENLWRWRLKAPNGRIIADSAESYSRRSGARKGFRSVQRWVPVAEIEVEE